MANRYFQQFMFSLNHMLTFLEGNAVIGAAGAVGTVKGSGIKTVTHNSTGKYTIVLEDKYPRYLGGFSGFVSTTFSGIVAVEVYDLTVDAHVADGTGIQLACYDKTGALADPASGAVLGFGIFLRNSSVVGKGE